MFFMNANSGQKLTLMLGLVLLQGCATQTTGPGARLVSEARTRLNLAESHRSEPSVAAGYYLEAAQLATQSASPKADKEDAIKIYNRASEELTVLLKSTPDLWNRTETFNSPHRTYRLHFAQKGIESGTWDPDYFTFFRTRQQVRRQAMAQGDLENGLGGRVVGVNQPKDPRALFLPVVGVAAPVTVTLEFAAAKKTTQDVTLVLNDPTKRSTVKMGGKSYPLSADLSAARAYYPDPKLLGFLAMLRPGDYLHRTGIYLMQPYDPNRIPVLLVHGLTAAPQLWFNLINDIEADPVTRGRFQFWVFGYPSGAPIAYSALQLRENLDKVYKIYPKTKNMVLVGHSMGGLLSQMQAINTKRILFDGIFKKNADAVYAKLPEDDVIKKALIFNANPHIREIIFICTPHRGSRLANGAIGNLGIWLIKLPGSVVKTMFNGMESSLEVIVQTNHNKVPDGIQGLSPKSPLLLTLNSIPVQPPFYTIVGTRGWPGPLQDSSDGVVPYWSSHLEGARAELGVPYFHSCCERPKTIESVKQILEKYIIHYRIYYSGRNVKNIAHP